MRWTARPERREMLIVVASFAIYFFAYHLDNLGMDGGVTRKILYTTTGFGKTRIIGPDGRKPPGWRDALETDIFGEWEWDSGHVVGHLRERSQPVATSRHGALWLWRKSASHPSEESVHNALRRWGNDIPQSKVVKHVPGYSILENVYIVNGTVYIVADSYKDFPPLDAIVSTTGRGFRRWVVLSAERGRQLFGPVGSMIRGVSWMSADLSHHNSTLFSLWRTYSSLDSTISSSGETTLPQPHRLLFPHHRFFTDAKTDQDLAHRRRFNTGIHPYTAKAAFPQLVIQDHEDWNDYMRIPVPFVFEKLVVADRRAAERSLKQNVPAFTSTLSLEVSSHWWEPIRQNMVKFLEATSPSQPVVTYIHCQSEQEGMKLSDSDHEALIDALLLMGKKYGYSIHIVSSQTSETAWKDRMSAIATSSIIVGVHGPHLMDSVFMESTTRSTVMEFFPKGTYAGENEVAFKSIGLKYMVWWDKEFSELDFPPPIPPQKQQITIDPPSLVRAIHKVLSS